MKCLNKSLFTNEFCDLIYCEDICLDGKLLRLRSRTTNPLRIIIIKNKYLSYLIYEFKFVTSFAIISILLLFYHFISFVSILFIWLWLTFSTARGEKIPKREYKKNSNNDTYIVNPIHWVNNYLKFFFESFGFRTFFLLFISV